MEQEENGLRAGGEGVGEGYIMSLTQEKTIPQNHN